MKSTITFLLVLCSLASSSYAFDCQNNEECNNGKCEQTIVKIPGNSSIVNVTGICECESTYMDFEGKPCNYELKKQSTAFLLSFFVGWSGADWFYLAKGNTGYNAVGAIKLIICTVSFTSTLGIIGIKRITSLRKKLQLEKSFKIMFSLLLYVWLNSTLATFVWWLVDWCRVLNDVFKDGNGMSLKNW